MPNSPTVSDADSATLAGALHIFIRVFLVAERSGAPAEGRLKFNPLHFQILGLLHREGAMRSSMLASRLGVRRSTLSSAAERLAGLSLVQRSDDPTDGRAVLYALTPEGAETAAAIRRQDIRNATALLSGLTAEERAKFVPLIGKVAANLESEFDQKQ